MPPVTPVSAVQRSSQRISGFSEEDDLDTVWSKILIRCNKITSWNLNDQTATLTVEAVIAKINPPKDSKKDSKDVAKKVFQNALVCVQRFGQIAANATSMVFGPSQNCFNAISFVISAVQEYDAVFASITALMERVSVFLEKLRIYLDDEGAETKLDKRLRKTVYRVLEHFLVIMGLAHKLTHGWKGRVKLAAKIGAFGEDPQVKDAMAKLETLIADETRTEITVIVKDLSEAARNIRGVDRKLDVITEEVEKIGSSLNVLQADAEGRKVEVDHRKRLETLSEAINLNASKKPWKDRQEELSAKAIPGTGQWLLEYQAATISFPRWADPQASDLNVLNVKADEGFGKSYLCSTVIRHLQDMHRDNSKVCIAYYYFQRDASEKNPINKAMKSIIWQLASGNTSLSKEYLRLAVRACDGKSDFSRTAELWQRLVSETAKHLEATVFIILDGIDEVESEPGKPLAGILRQVRDLEQDAQMRIRVLLTGRPTGLDALKDDVGGYLPEIDIAAPGRQSSLNEEDILAYAQYRLDNMTTFHSKDEKMIERVQDLKERAKRELAAGVYGDFLALDYKLDDLANLRNFGQVQEVLDRAKEGRSEAIARKVEQLNEILSKDEIEEVNELIMWTTTAYTDLSLHQYDLILRLKTGVQTLISLEKQVTEKYRSIFAVDEGYVALRSEDIREHLYSSAKMPEEDGTLQIGQQKSAPLQEGEVALVRKILKTHFRNVFGEEDVYRRFAFDAFFDSKLGDRKVQIYLTSVDGSHVRLAQACLVVVCDKLADEDFRPLHNYAFGWLARHLREVNLENVGDSFKEDTGRKLARLLTDTTIIDAWWTADRMYQAVDWVFDDFYTFAVHRWFEDPVVLNGLRDMPKERQWITDVLDNEGPVTRILVHIAKRMAEHWFAKKLPLSLEAFKWLFGYHRQMVLLGKGRAITPEELLAISYHDLPWNSEKISVEDIVAVEKLAKESLLEEGDEAKWHHLMGTTLHEFEKYSSAIERYREALKHGQDDWMLRLGLARALNLSNLDRRQRETTEEVVAVLRSLMEYNELLLETDTEYRRRYWEDILFLLALQFTKLDKHTEAEETYKKIFQEGVDKNDFDDPSQRAALALFACLNWQEKHDEVIDFVEQLSARTHMLGNWLVALFDTSFDNTDLHGRVISSANHAGRLGTIIKLYQDIVDAAKSEMPPRPTAFRIDISHWLASIMFSRRAQDQRRIALNLWNEIMDIGLADAVRDSFRISQILELASRKYAIALLDVAREAGLSSLAENSKDHIYRLEKLTVQQGDLVNTSIDIRLTLARLHHLAGVGNQSRNFIRAHLKRALEYWDEKPSIDDDDDDTMPDLDARELSIFGLANFFLTLAGRLVLASIQQIWRSSCLDTVAFTFSRKSDFRSLAKWVLLLGIRHVNSYELTLVGKRRPEFRLAGISPEKEGDRYQDFTTTHATSWHRSKPPGNAVHLNRTTICSQYASSRDRRFILHFATRKPTLQQLQLPCRRICYSQNAGRRSSFLPQQRSQLYATFGAESAHTFRHLSEISAGTALAIFRMLIPYVPASETFYVASASCRGSSGRLVPREFGKRWQQCFVYWTKQSESSTKSGFFSISDFTKLKDKRASSRDQSRS